MPSLYAAACDDALQSGPSIPLPTELDEISGLAGSPSEPGVVWAVADGGSAASVYALDLEGNVLATVAVDGASNYDWEDLAVGPSPDGSAAPWLYVADIGDNDSTRRTVTIYGFAEPSIADGAVVPEVITATYEGGATDAEALAVTTEGIWVLGKDWGGEPAQLYVLDWDAVSDAAPDVFVKAGSGTDISGDLVTAMDASQVNGVAVVRTYGSLTLFELTSGDVAEALAGEPCHGPNLTEGQGESVAVLADGSGLVTASEAGRGPAELHILRPTS